MAKLIWTEEALIWLREIDDYLGRQSNAAAVRVLDGILSRAELLCDHPRSGAQFLDISGREVREIFFGNYRIIYEFDSEMNAVYVLAVVHSSMDIERLRF